MKVYRIENVTIHDTPRDMYHKLKAMDLDAVDRKALIHLAKLVDERIEKRSALDFDYYWPWILLIQYLDPMAVLRWPNPDWSAIE